MEPMVRRAHISVASLIPEVTAHKLFDHMLHKEIDAERGAFNAPIASSFACELFDSLPQWDDEEMFVIWDTKVIGGVLIGVNLLQQASPLCCAYKEFDEMPLKDNAAALPEQVMFSKPMEDVIWDEEVLEQEHPVDE
jgi:hypothetical protein